MNSVKINQKVQSTCDTSKERAKARRNFACICKKGPSRGSLAVHLGCDFCERVYHKTCVPDGVNALALGVQWMCPVCVANTALSQNSTQETDSFFNSQSQFYPPSSEEMTSLDFSPQIDTIYPVMYQTKVNENHYDDVFVPYKFTRIKNENLTNFSLSFTTSTTRTNNLVPSELKYVKNGVGSSMLYLNTSIHSPPNSAPGRALQALSRRQYLILQYCVTFLKKQLKVLNLQAQHYTQYKQISVHLAIKAIQHALSGSKNKDMRDKIYTSQKQSSSTGVKITKKEIENVLVLLSMMVGVCSSVLFLFHQHLEENILYHYKEKQ